LAQRSVWLVLSEESNSPDTAVLVGQEGSDSLERCQAMETMSRERSRPRLVIADDHAIFAEALKTYLERAYQVVGMVSDGRALVEAVLSLRPQVIVVDVAMPILNGLDAARKIKELTSNVKFVFLTMQVDPNLAAAALELGPIAFVLKSSTGTELLKAIDHVLHGKTYLTPQLKADDWVATRVRARQFTKELTPRQREIVQLFAEGRPLKEIAWVLNLSEKTVEFHKHHIMEAFNLKSNAGLILFAVKHGLISVDPEPCTHAVAAKYRG
jgi:DNA-binding NarL/FixJ family response regulator